jgi:uncharacterized phage-associated protein
MYLFGIPFALENGMKTNNTLNTIDLAKYIVALKGPLSHLKLQKLAYYVEAWHMVMMDDPLIEDDFQAWIHGPVCPSIWHYFKEQSILHSDLDFRASEKRSIKKEIENKLSPEQVELISDVLEEYGKRSAYYLECLTHEEDPWRNARKNKSADCPSNAVISKKAMRKFYTLKYEQTA